jgi:hypothetical protein
VIYISFLHKEDLSEEERKVFEEENREDWRVSEIDANRCPCCGRLLNSTYELDEAYGAPMRVYIDYCDWCGYERR